MRRLIARRPAVDGAASGTGRPTAGVPRRARPPWPAWPSGAGRPRLRRGGAGAPRGRRCRLAAARALGRVRRPARRCPDAALTASTKVAVLRARAVPPGSSTGQPWWAVALAGRRCSARCVDAATLTCSSRPQTKRARTPPGRWISHRVTTPGSTLAAPGQADDVVQHVLPHPQIRRRARGTGEPGARTRCSFSTAPPGPLSTSQRRCGHSGSGHRRTCDVQVAEAAVLEFVGRPEHRRPQRQARAGPAASAAAPAIGCARRAPASFSGAAVPASRKPPISKQWSSRERLRHFSRLAAIRGVNTTWSTVKNSPVRWAMRASSNRFTPSA